MPDDVRRIAACLCPKHLPTTGAGASPLPGVFAGFRALVTKGLENQLLWGSEIRDLLRETGVEIVGSAPTFTRALMRFVEMTGLGRRDGRRFWILFGDLRRADSELIAMIRERFLPMPDEVRPDVVPPAAPPSMSPTPAAGASTTAPPPAPPAGQDIPVAAVSASFARAGVPAADVAGPDNFAGPAATPSGLPATGVPEAVTGTPRLMARLDPMVPLGTTDNRVSVALANPSTGLRYTGARRPTRWRAVSPARTARKSRGPPRS